MMSTQPEDTTDKPEESQDIDMEKQVTTTSKPSTTVNGVDDNNSSHQNTTDSNDLDGNATNNGENNDSKSSQSNQQPSTDTNQLNSNGQSDNNTSSTTETKEAPSTSNVSTTKLTGKKRKREKTRWGPPPRKKRWGSKQDAIKNTSSLISNLIKISNQKQTNTAIASAMFGNAWNEQQTKIFLLKNQLQDVSTRLIAPGAFVATQPEENRSPSPEPIYDQKGVRINTREYRLREKLQKQRIEIIQQLIGIDPTYQPPSDYKPPKLTHKIMMPVDDYPDYNFFGLIVGPRGNTQKEMQKETGCKIAVRGQGACLDKPGRLVHPDDNEPLHVHITAPNQESMDKATKMINDLLEEVKTGGGEHKAKQLRELATINGTLRIESRCRICGGQHPIYRCPEKTGEKWTPADVQCKICGELTHVTEDCKHYKKGKNYTGANGYNQSRPSIDAEYTAFMQELIGDGPSSSSRPVAAITAPTATNNANGDTNTKVMGNSNTAPSNPLINGSAPNTMPIAPNGSYHNVPPPNQNGVKPPAEYQNGGKATEKEKEGTSNGNETGNNTVNKNVTNGAKPNNGKPFPQPMANRTMTNGHMMPPMYPPNGMMAPNPYMYGMSMPPMNPYAMRPTYPMPMNPYMARPTMPPFPTNPYSVPPNPYTMQPNPYGVPPPQQPNIPPPPPPPPSNPPQ